MAARARPLAITRQSFDAFLAAREDVALPLGMTAFIVVQAGDEAVAVRGVEPHDSSAHVTSAQKPGIRLTVVPQPRALLMPEPPEPGDRPDLQCGRQIGWGARPRRGDLSLSFNPRRAGGRRLA
jgi:hypothetical protein